MGIIQNMKFAAYNMYAKSITGGQMMPHRMQDKALFKDWDTETAIKEGYKASVYVYKSIDKIAKASASVPWKVHKLNKAGKWEPLEGHPLEALLEQPNEFMDRTVMIERITSHLYLAGNGLLTKVRGVGDEVLELWPVNPQYVTPVTSKEDFIKSYEYKDGPTKYNIEPKDIIHAMFIDPANVYWGMAPLQVAAKTVDTDIEAVNWNKIALQNRAVPDGALVSDAPLTRVQWEEGRRQLREQKQGASNARDTWLLGGGLKFQQFSLSPVEMDFLNSRKMTREEICSTFDVPPPIVGIMENSTYANMEEARRIFWEDTVIPHLGKLRQIFNQTLVKEFQREGEILYIDYDTSGVVALRANEEKQSATVRNYWGMGVPFNELNRRFDLGFTDIEGGDAGFIGSGLLPAGIDFSALAIEPPADPVAAPADPAADPLKADDDTKKSNGAAAASTKTARISVKGGINLETEEQKAIYWKSQERRRLSFYAKWTRDAASAFKSEGQEVAAAYKKGGAEAALDVVTAPRTQKKWAAQYLGNYKTVVKEFGESAFNDVKSFAAPLYTKAEEEVEAPPPPAVNPLAAITFDPYDATIQQYLIQNAALKVTGVMDFTKQTIAGIILDMEKDGADVDDVAKAINKRYDDFSINRAFTIARTEVAAASNYGLYAAGEQASEYVGGMKKGWINSSDKRVRDSHDFKEYIAMDEKFKNGLLYPGDMTNGSGKDVIKCRCTLGYRVL